MNRELSLSKQAKFRSRCSKVLQSNCTLDILVICELSPSSLREGKAFQRKSSQCQLKNEIPPLPEKTKLLGNQIYAETWSQECANQIQVRIKHIKMSVDSNMKTEDNVILHNNKLPYIITTVLRKRSGSVRHGLLFHFLVLQVK